MEEEIDLRKYVEVLIRRWWLIVAVTLVMAVAAYIVSSLLSPTYEASSVVIVTQPRYYMQFDPRFQTEEIWRPAYQAFPTLATSDQVLYDVLNAYDPSSEVCIEEWTLGALSGMVEATSEDDPSLVVLKARSCSPQGAATIVNVWAKVLAKRGNEIYGGTEDDVVFFEEQVTQAEQALNEADAALIEFEARNETDIVGAQLDSLKASQTHYLADQRTITYIIQDINGLRDQLAQQPEEGSATLADELTALFLQIKAFNASFDAEASAPIQLQVSSAESLSSKSLAGQIAFLDDLVSTLQAKSAEIDGRLGELEPQILALQQRIEEINVESDYLHRARDLAGETYTSLARKLEESRIAAQEEDRMLQVGSYAAVPQRPVGPRSIFNTAIAGMMGLMLSVFGVLAIEWWRRGAVPRQREQEKKEPE